MSWADIIGQLFGEPGKYWFDLSIEDMIRFESVHFLSSAFMGVFVYWLTWTILSRHISKACDRYIYHVSLVLGLFCALLLHVCIDVFTTLA